MILVITACLATHPGVCRVDEIPLTINANQGMCQMIGQIEMAKPGGWKDHNRGWIVKDYKCAEVIPFNRPRRAEKL